MPAYVFRLKIFLSCGAQLGESPENSRSVSKICMVTAYKKSQGSRLGILEPLPENQPMLQLESRRRRILQERLYRVQRQVVQVLADAAEFFEDVVRDGDDLAADLVGLEDIVEFARARPQQFALLDLLAQ